MTVGDWSVGRGIAPPDDGKPDEVAEKIVAENKTVTRNKPGPKVRFKDGVKEVVVRLTPDMLERIKNSVDMGKFKSRSDVIREALIQYYFPPNSSSSSLNTKTTTNTVLTMNLPMKEEVRIGKLSFDITHQPGFFRRKMLKWFFGVTVRG